MANYAAQSQQTQDYLGNIEDPLAQGKGGYNPDEAAAIRLTPEQQQRMVTGAGISAGTGTAAAVGGAQRAANAAGGNPLALAAYRARAAQTQGAQTGDAMTQARIAASDTAAGREENIAQARLGQQNQGLQYYQGLQAQQNANAQAAMNRPSTFDKVMGGVSGALSFLDEGGTGRPAVVGEGSPEKIVDLAGRDYMDDGGSGFDLTPSGGFDLYPENSMAESAAPTSAPQQSWFSRFRQAGQQGQQRQQQPGMPGATPQAFNPVDSYKTIGKGLGMLGASFLDDGGTGDAEFSRSGGERILHRLGYPDHQPPSKPVPDTGGDAEFSESGGERALHRLGYPDRAPGAPRLRAPSASPAPSYRSRPMNQQTDYRADGGMGAQGRNGIFTKPTKVLLGPNDGVVPLKYRAHAKMRPSMAALPAARNTGAMQHASYLP